MASEDRGIENEIRLQGGDNDLGTRHKNQTTANGKALKTHNATTKPATPIRKRHAKQGRPSDV